MRFVMNRFARKETRLLLTVTPLVVVIDKGEDGRVRILMKLKVQICTVPSRWDVDLSTHAKIVQRHLDRSDYLSAQN